MTDMHEGGNGSLLGSAQAKVGEMRDSAQEMVNSSQAQAGEMLDRMRLLLDQASQMLRDFGTQSGQWTQAAQNRAGEMARQASDMARQLRDQSGVAVDSVSRQVERNPLTSIGIAFAVGFACAALVARR